MRCPKCTNPNLGPEDFYKDRSRANGLRRVCKTCDRQSSLDYRTANADKVRKTSIEWAKKNPERRKKLNRDANLRAYGLVEGLFDEMSTKQNGRCASCGELPHGKKHEARLQVDHDHKTQKIRGLLCGRCNRALGLLRDSPELIQRLLEYVTRSR